MRARRRFLGTQKRAKWTLSPHFHSSVRNAGKLLSRTTSSPSHVGIWKLRHRHVLTHDLRRLQGWGQALSRTTVMALAKVVSQLFAVQDTETLHFLHTKEPISYTGTRCRLSRIVAAETLMRGVVIFVVAHLETVSSTVMTYTCLCPAGSLLLSPPSTLDTLFIPWK